MKVTISYLLQDSHFNLEDSHLLEKVSVKGNDPEALRE